MTTAMPENEKKNTGALGETLAARHLQRLGYTLLERNLHIGGGELDLIAIKEDTLVFVEVKARHGSSHGSAGESITAAKARKLARAALAFLTTTNVSHARSRCDVIAITLSDRAPPSIDHYEDCIDLAGALNHERWRQ